MSLAIQRFKVYAKLVLIVTVTGVGLVTVWMNRHNQVTFWFFKDFRDVSVLSLMAITAGAAVVGWRLLRYSRHVLRDLRELWRAEQLRELNRRRTPEQTPPVESVPAQDSTESRGDGSAAP